MDKQRLLELRDEMDRADADLLNAFDRRMAVSAEIAAWKKASGMAIRDSAREAAKIEHVRAQSAYPDAAAALYETLFSLSRNYQEQLNKTE